MNTQCCMLIGWEHNETRSRAKISSHTLRQGVSSNRNQSMMVSLHHHGNNNQLRHVNKWNLNECVHMWTLDGNSKQPFPKINKTNIQLQLNSKASKDQVWLKHKHSNSFHLIIIFILLIQFKIIPFWCTAGQWGCETQPHIHPHENSVPSPPAHHHITCSSAPHTGKGILPQTSNVITHHHLAHQHLNTCTNLGRAYAP